MFEYTANDLKIRTANAADHQSVECYFEGWGSKSGPQQVKIILGSLPLSTECEIMGGMREKGMEASQARHAPIVCELLLSSRCGS